ncbi:MAG: GEVED domain-containing protein, partial [Thiolinea sp.]
MNIPLFNKRLLTLPLLICFSLLLCVSANAYAALDYGDAPESYGDAAHTIVTGLHLGATPGDAEADSQHSYNAFGDGDFQSDGAGNWYLSGDEDGAPRQPVSDYIPLFPILKMTAMTYSADFTVTNTLGNTATLFGWIDFDGNGSFEADEGTSVLVSNGSNQSSVSLNWNVPVDIKAGTTFIRLRLTSDSSISTATPTG